MGVRVVRRGRGQSGRLPHVARSLGRKLMPGFRRLAFEPLEDRRLLSVDPNSILPGMTLVDPNSLDRIAGQVIYLDFDGAQDVTYSGPVTVGPFDVPAFSAKGLGLEGQVGTPTDLITHRVALALAPLGVIVTDRVPEISEYSPIYVGGSNNLFLRYGALAGLAEVVDVGNAFHDDKGFVFSDAIASGEVDQSRFASAIADIAAHEAGHLLGFSHVSRLPLTVHGEVAYTLDDVAHKMEVGQEVCLGSA